LNDILRIHDQNGARLIHEGIYNRPKTNHFTNHLVTNHCFISVQSLSIYHFVLLVALVVLLLTRT